MNLEPLRNSGINLGNSVQNTEHMKRLSTLLALVFMLTSMNAQSDFIDSVETKLNELHRVSYPVFKKGEKLEYVVHYGFVDAGVATVEVMNEDHNHGKHNVYHVVGTGRSKGAFDWFFKVRDRYESYIDAERMHPYVFKRNVNEGGYEFYQEYTFFHKRNIMHTHKNTLVVIPYGVQDMMSAYYFARTLNMSKYKPGDVIVMQAVVDEKLEPLKIRYVGREEVEVRNGTYRCLKFQPLVQKGRVFNDPEDLTVYVTDDLNKIPVLLKADILVGSIKMELTNYKNVKFPIARI